LLFFSRFSFSYYSSSSSSLFCPFPFSIH
jgi:hypothetical protein